MTDLRKYANESQGLLGQIELSIPGLSGYRIRENLRMADNILRSYMADQIETEIKRPIEEIGEKLTKSLELDSIGDVKECINQIKGLEAKVRHAEHGYSGIFPQFKIREQELNKIYEFDLALINQLRDIKVNAHSLDNFIYENKMNDLKKAITDIKNQARIFENNFNQRLYFIKLTDAREE